MKERNLELRIEKLTSEELEAEEESELQYDNYLEELEELRLLEEKAEKEAEEESELQHYNYLEELEEIYYHDDFRVHTFDMEEFSIVKFYSSQYIKLQDIVNYEIENICNYETISCYSKYKKMIISSVRNNNDYKKLKKSIKNKLTSCVISSINSNDKLLYAFNLDIMIFEIFMTSCEETFAFSYDDVEDIDDILDLLDGLEINLTYTIEELEERLHRSYWEREDAIHRKMFFINKKYIKKLEEIKDIVVEMIEGQPYKADPVLKHHLLEYIIDNQKLSIKSRKPRRYRGKIRKASKEETRKKAIELKNIGLGNNQIALRLKKSKGYISDLLTGKK